MQIRILESFTFEKILNMLRFIFSIAVFYVVIKIVRLLVDPFFQTNTAPSNRMNTSPKSKPQEPNLGEYVDYEEVK